MRRTGVLVEDVVNLRFDLGSRKPRGGNGTGPPCVAHAQLLKLQRSGRFPRQDRPTKIKYAQSHKVKVTRGTDNLTTTGMNEIELEGKYQIIRTVFTYFFSRIVI